MTGQTVPGRFLQVPVSNGPFLRLIYPDSVESFRYEDILNAALSWTSFYRELGLNPGDRVVIVLKHSQALYASFIGAILGGFIPAMFAFPSVKFSEAEYSKTIGQLLRNASPRALITYPELKNLLRNHAADLPNPALVHDFTEMRSNPAAVDSLHNAAPEDIAFLQYSSGTTGVKKGVAVSHRALLWQIDQYAKEIKLTENDVIISWLPLYHDMGLIACLFLPFLTRTRLVALSPFDWVERPARFMKAISEYKGTLAWLPNFSYNFMAKNVQVDDMAGIDLSSLRGLVNCSEPILAGSHELFLGRYKTHGLRETVFAASYAMAENTFAVTSGGFKGPLVQTVIDGRKLVSSGRALPETQIEIRSSEGMPVPDGKMGEIAIQTPCLMNEYFENPADTEKAMSGGWYLTGDLGYRVNGEIYVVGRKKDMLILAGQNIYPQDIENIVNEVRGIVPGRCVALGMTNADLGTEELIILAETAAPASEHSRIKNEIRKRVSETLDASAREIILFPERWLLKSTSGKISRTMNREKYLQWREESMKQAGPFQERDQSGLRDKVFTAVLRAAGGRCSEAELGDDDPVFSSGLIDSLGLVSFLLDIETRCQVRIPESMLKDLNAIDSVNKIVSAVQSLQNSGARETAAQDFPQSGENIRMDLETPSSPRAAAGFWTLYYKILFTFLGIQYGKGLKVMGPLLLRLEGNPRNIRMGDNVTLMPWVDLKVRENGKIILGNDVLLDSFVRLVAARESTIRLGDMAKVGIGSVLNGGADILVGNKFMCGGYCNIVSSAHLYRKGSAIMDQGFEHAATLIGEDVWLGAGVFVECGSKVGNGAILGIYSVLNGNIPANAIALGNPARVVKFRS